MRLFAALTPPGGVLDALQAELDRVRALAAGDPAVRWTSRSTWHLTLAFYGEDEPDSRTPWLASRLRGHRPLRLGLRGAGTFTGVLWAGVYGDLDALDGLAAAAADDSRDDVRPYHPHLTLARWKHPRRPPVVRLARRELTEYRGPQWQAADVVLMQSRLGHEGPRYQELHRFLLDG